jgi:hypothetical protein
MDHYAEDQDGLMERKTIDVMMKGKKLVTLFLLLVLTISARAQDKTDLMRDNGRIYVVVAVMVTILLGIILYLVRLDRKMGKLEKENRP